MRKSDVSSLLGNTDASRYVHYFPLNYTACAPVAAIGRIETLTELKLQNPRDRM